MLSIARIYVGDTHLSEDVVHDAFISLIRNEDRIKTLSTPQLRAYIVTHLKVEGHDAYTFVEGDLVSIVWLNENMSRTFSMFTTKVAEESVIDFAEAIAQQFA